MPSMNDLVRAHSTLDARDLEWLHLIVADWQMLADLSFADLVLWVPTADETRYVAVAQMRPNTGPTSYPDDLVGHVVPRGKRPLLDQALDEGRIIREGDPEWREAVPVRVEAIPVRRADRVISVIGRNTNLLTARTPSRLELTYLQTAADLAQMIATGRFPYPKSRSHLDAMPRVGDGMIRLDADASAERFESAFEKARRKNPSARAETTRRNGRDVVVACGLPAEVQAAPGAPDRTGAAREP